MKKLLAAIVFVASATAVSAQNSNVVSASRHLEDFNKDHDTNDLHDAKSFIDLATVNEKTMNEPKTFLYRGEVYQTIFETQVTNTQNAILKATGKLDQAALQDAHVQGIAKADTTAISIAVSAYAKTIQMDPKSEYADEAKQGLQAAGLDMLNKAIVDKNNQHYGSALVFFDRVIQGDKAIGVPDTSRTYKQLLQSTAYCAEKVNNYPKAIQFFTEMSNIKGGSYSYNEVPFSELYRIYLMQKDTDKALAVVARGRAMYPDNMDLLNDETNGYLWKNQSDKAEGNLQTAIDKLNAKSNLTDAEKDLRARLYFILGTIFDNMANPIDPATEPANYADLFHKADTNYIMASHADEKFYEPCLNIGAMYLKRVRKIYNKMNDMTAKNPKANTKALDDQAKALLVKAEPYLEKAHTLKPDDSQVKKALLQLYANTGQDDKANALRAEK